MIQLEKNSQGISNGRSKCSKTRKTINAKRATQKPEGGGKPGEERPGEL